MNSMNFNVSSSFLVLKRYFPISIYGRFFADLRGRMAMRMAFSCTCQPNMKEPKAQISRQRKKPAGPLGRSHRCATAGCEEKNKDDKIKTFAFVIKKSAERPQLRGRRDTPGWTAACTQVRRRETRRARPRAETPAPSRPSLKLEEAPPPPAASAWHLNR